MPSAPDFLPHDHLAVDRAASPWDCYDQHSHGMITMYTSRTYECPSSSSKIEKTNKKQYKLGFGCCSDLDLISTWIWKICFGWICFSVSPDLAVWCYLDPMRNKHFLVPRLQSSHRGSECSKYVSESIPSWRAKKPCSTTDWLVMSVENSMNTEQYNMNMVARWTAIGVTESLTYFSDLSGISHDTSSSEQQRWVRPARWGNREELGWWDGEKCEAVNNIPCNYNSTDNAW